MADDDVIFKLSGDVNNLVVSLDRVIQQFDGMFTRMDQFAARTEPAIKKTETALDGLFGTMVGGTAIGTALGNAITGAFNLMVDGIERAATFLPRLIEQVAQTGDRFLTLSNTTGVAVDALSQFDFVASQTSTSVQAITNSIFLMQRNLTAGGQQVDRALRLVGKSAADLRAAKPEQAFIEILEGLREIPNQADRTTAGMAIFGRQFRTIASLAQEDIRGLMREADALGLTMDRTVAQLGDRFTDAQDKLRRTFEGVQRQLAVALLPVATEALERFQQILTRLFSDSGFLGADWADRLADTIRGPLMSFFDWLESALETIKAHADTVIAIWVGVREAIESGRESVQNLVADWQATPDTIHTVGLAATGASVGFAALAGVLGDTTTALGEVTREGTRWSTAIRLATDFINRLGEPAVGLLSKAVNGLGAALSEIGVAILNAFDRAMIPVIEAIAAAVGRLALAANGLAAAILRITGLGAVFATMRTAVVGAVAAMSLSWTAFLVRIEAISPAIANALLQLSTLRASAGLLSTALYGIQLAVTAVVAAFAAWAAFDIGKRIGEWIDSVTGLSKQVAILALQWQGYSREQAKAMIAEQDHLKFVQDGIVSYKALNEASEERRKRIADEIRSLLSYKQTVEELSASAQLLGERGELGPVVLGRIARQAKALAEEGVKLPPILQNIVDAYERMNRSVSGGRTGSSIDDDKTPLGKFRKDVIGLSESVNIGVQAGAEWSAILDRFGAAAAKAVDDARFIPGALEAIPPAVREVAAEFNQLRFQEVTASIRIATKNLADAFLKPWREGQAKAGAALTAFIATTHKQQLTLQRALAKGALSETGKALADIDDQQQAAFDDLQARFDEARKEMEGGLIPPETFAAMAEQFEDTKADIRAFYDDARAQAQRYTGDVVRDAAQRGIKTRAQLNAELSIEQFHLKNMLDHREQFTKEAIAKQQEIVRSAERAAKGESSAWERAFDGLISALDASADSFARLGQITGKTDGVLQKIGETVSHTATILGDVRGLIKAEGVIQTIIAALKLAVDGVAALWDAFTRSPGEDVARRVGHDLGIVIAEELGDTIAATAKDVFGGDRFAAELAHFQDLIKAGADRAGVSLATFARTNFDVLIGRLRDTFALIEQGTITIDQASEILDESFSTLLDAGTDAYGRISDKLKEIIRLNQQFGIESKAIGDFLKGQGETLLTALSGTIAGGTPFAQMTEDLEKLREKRDQLVGDKRPHQILRMDPKDREELARLDDEIADLSDRLKTGAAGAAQELADLGTQAVASFAAAVRAGVPWAEALEQIGPSLETIRKNYETLGLSIEDAGLKALVTQGAIAQSNPALVQGISALSAQMTALENLGGITPDAFAAMQRTAARFFADLTEAAAEAGGTATDALLPMQQFLHDAARAARELGVPLDAATATMIENSKAAGIWREEQQSLNDVMITGFSAIIEALGGQIPEAWRTMAEAAKAATAEAADAAAEAAANAAQGVEDAADAAGEATKTLFDMTQEELAQWQERLRARDYWIAFAGNAQTAARIASGAMDGIDGAIDDVSDLLVDTEWDRWADEAEEAASRAKEAVEAVAWGASPGGIREIGTQFALASRAATAFRSHVVSQMAAAKAAAESVVARAPQISASVGRHDVAGIGGGLARTQVGPSVYIAAGAFPISTWSLGSEAEMIKKKLTPAVLTAIHGGGTNYQYFESMVRRVRK